LQNIILKLLPLSWTEVEKGDGSCHLLPKNELGNKGVKCKRPSWFLMCPKFGIVSKEGNPVFKFKSHWYATLSPTDTLTDIYSDTVHSAATGLGQTPCSISDKVLPLQVGL
jgi:hypothetical protein